MLPPHFPEWYLALQKVFFYFFILSAPVWSFVQGL